jgi:hypothetical protein
MVSMVDDDEVMVRVIWMLMMMMAKKGCYEEVIQIMMTEIMLLT